MANSTPTGQQLGQNRKSTPREFERLFSEFVGSREGVATRSGRAALALALQCSGIRKGDEVIIPSVACGAVADAVFSLGAVPALADCNMVDGNIDASKLEGTLSKKTRALIAVHYQGLPCDVDQIAEFARKNEITLIEDCAHSIGSRFASKNLGLFGDYAVYSFGPDKAMTTGSGGMLVSSAEAHGDSIRKLHTTLGNMKDDGGLGLVKNLAETQLTRNKRAYGVACMSYFPIQRMVSSMIHRGYEVNQGPISKLAAGIGIAQLQSISQVLIARERNAGRMQDMLERSESFQAPEFSKTKEPVFLRFTILSKSRAHRDAVVLRLKRSGIEAGPVNWRVPLHQSSKYSPFCERRVSYEGATAFCQRFVNLPCHQLLEEDDFETMNRCLTL